MIRCSQLLLASIATATIVSGVAFAQVSQQGAGALPTPLVLHEGVGAHAPDLAALRYYASRGEMQNYQKEIARLRAFHPGWSAPLSPEALVQSGDEKQLWALYADDDLDGINRAMRERVTRQPGWRPSAELREKVANKAARLRIVAADEADRWTDVLSLSRTLSGNVLQSDIDLRWRVARAQALTGQSGQAIEDYTSLLMDFPDRELQRSTLSKGLEILGVGPITTLIDDHGAHIDPNVAKIFRLEIVRRRLVASAAGTPDPELRAADLERFESAALADGEETSSPQRADDAALLGWFYIAKSEPVAAQRWFNRARSLGKTDLKTVEGLVLALTSMDATMRLASRDLPRQAALTLVKPLWTQNDDLGHRFIDLVGDELYGEPPRVIASDLLQAVSEATTGLRSAVGAEALAWYAYNVRQYPAAKVWFAKANQWEPSDSRLFGHMLAHFATNDEAAAEAIAARYGSQHPRLAQLLREHQAASKVETTGSVKSTAATRRRVTSRGRINPIVAAHDRGDHATCLRLIAKRQKLSADLLQMKGWCLLLAERPAEAAIAFEASGRAQAGRNRRDSAYGTALAALRSGHTEQALNAARNEGLTADQRRTISVEALTQRARAAFNRRDYAASLYSLNLRRQMVSEPRDLSMLRGWSHYHLGRKSQARTIFATLDQHLSTRDTRRALSQFRR
ncbi:MAG: hypothetical protein AAFY73_01360 [Pseudomonadota bacterium]